MSNRFVFITQEDPFYVRIFFEEFFAKYAQRERIAAVVIAPSMGKKSIGALAKQMYDFYGPVDFVRMGCRYVFYKLAQKLPRSRNAKKFYSIKQVCRAYGVPVIVTPSVNAPEFLAELRKLDPQLVASVAAPQIFRDGLINLPPLGCINIHNSKLPKYRGMLPNFWQMFHGEKQIGCTIHRINGKLDDGAILLQREAPADPAHSLHERICTTKRQGASLMIDAIEGAFAGTLRESANDSAQATHFTFPTKQEAREFRRRGMKLL
jgi:methionyl-tRNA formyltransferase